MTPTPEEFQAVAEWLGVEINWYEGSTVPWIDYKTVGLRTWQPHLPGADCFALTKPKPLVTDTTGTIVQAALS